MLQCSNPSADYAWMAKIPIQYANNRNAMHVSPILFSIREKKGKNNKHHVNRQQQKKQEN
jgi:hypothetical protein